MSVDQMIAQSKSNTKDDQVTKKFQTQNKAGLALSYARTYAFLAAATGRRVSKQAVLTMMSASECCLELLLEQALLVAKQEGKNQIKPEYIVHAIEASPELTSLFAGFATFQNTHMMKSGIAKQRDSASTVARRVRSVMQNIKQKKSGKKEKNKKKRVDHLASAQKKLAKANKRHKKRAREVDSE